ncbi:MAG TPA: hypothetical protein VLK36_07190 [Gaiellaceae bacterium]|nr:hypothetical protein [Gaiellaceae bacterium]
MIAPRRLVTATFLTAALALPSLFPAGSAADSLPRVSVISDSILTSVTWNKDGVALADLSNGLDLEIDAGVGRRLNGQSAEFEGSYVPTTLSVISSWQYQLGPTVVIVDGYNDLPGNFAGDVELTLDTLRDHGVQHVLWTNLHEVRPEFAAKNAVLAAAARRHPELRILDWNSYSAAHPEWYQNDFIHLMPSGGVAIATFIRQAIADILNPPPPDPALVVARRQAIRGHVGVHVDRHLHVSGGTAPLRFHTRGRALRSARLHLLANGTLSGTPTHAGRFVLPIDVTDARGSIAHLTVVLTVGHTTTRRIASRNTTRR